MFCRFFSRVLWLIYLFQVSVKLLLGLFVTFGRWMKRHCVKNSPQFLREIVESVLGGHREKEPIIDRRKY